MIWARIGRPSRWRSGLSPPPIRLARPPARMTPAIIGRDRKAGTAAGGEGEAWAAGPAQGIRPHPRREGPGLDRGAEAALREASRRGSRLRHREGRTGRRLCPRMGPLPCVRLAGNRIAAWGAGPGLPNSWDGSGGSLFPGRPREAPVAPPRSGRPGASPAEGEGQSAWRMSVSVRSRPSGRRHAFGTVRVAVRRSSCRRRAFCATNDLWPFPAAKVPQERASGTGRRPVAAGIPWLRSLGGWAPAIETGGGRRHREG